MSSFHGLRNVGKTTICRQNHNFCLKCQRSALTRSLIITSVANTPTHFTVKKAYKVGILSQHHYLLRRESLYYYHVLSYLPHMSTMHARPVPLSLLLRRDDGITRPTAAAAQPTPPHHRCVRCGPRVCGPPSQNTGGDVCIIRKRKFACQRH